jgi:beta-ureidopropionase
MKRNISRRNFLRQTALTTGMASVVSFELIGKSAARPAGESGSTHELWIAGVSQMGMTAKTPEEMTEKILGLLKDVLIYKPDFVCIPEVFPFANIEEKLSYDQRVKISEKVLEQFAEFSNKNNCYTICPVLTSTGGKIFNSAVVFDRKGQKIGQYDKIHETVEWVSGGVTCGAVFQPVIQTEFGPIGIQICYDINWEDSWKMLRDQGVKIIFWPSAFDGGMQLNMKALQNKCVVASSTRKNVSKLCDMTGETITQTGIWLPNLYCGPVNLEKAFIPLYDYLDQAEDIRKKYGRKVKITMFHPEEWTIIECVSRDLFIKDIMAEFNLISHPEGLKEAEIIQNKSRT